MIFLVLKSGTGGGELAASSRCLFNEGEGALTVKALELGAEKRWQ